MVVTQKADDITQVEDGSKMKIYHFHLSIVKDGWIGKREVATFEDFRETLHGHRNVSFQIMRAM